jgi:hypothetical protein
MARAPKLDLSWMDPPKAPTEEKKKVVPEVKITADELACSDCGERWAWWLYQGFRYCKGCAPEWLRKPTEENVPRG